MRSRDVSNEYDPVCRTISWIGVTVSLIQMLGLIIYGLAKLIS
jgi:hypothetical protein